MKANQCDQLTTLEGLQNCNKLAELSSSVMVEDHAALMNNHNIIIHVSLSDELDVLPKKWVASINQLKNSELHFKCTNSKFDFSQLSLLKNVKTLNLEEVWFPNYYEIKLDSMGWLLEMPNLQSLRFKQRGSMAYVLGSSVYTDMKKLRKLQEKICVEGGFTRPAFLITDS
jgi:hypothetical protein